MARLSWQEVNRATLGIDKALVDDAYNLWFWLRPGYAVRQRFIVERSDAVSEEAWQHALANDQLTEPPAYAKDRRPISTATRPVTASGVMPAQSSLGKLTKEIGGGHPILTRVPGARPSLLRLAVQEVLSFFGSPSRTGASAQAPTRELASAAPNMAPSHPPVVAVIDDACAFLHPAFTKPTALGRTTRFISVWDQTEPDDSSMAVLNGSTPPEMGYGMELDTPAINRLLAEADETTGYRKCRQNVPGDSNWTHGTHVMGLAAGFPEPNTNQVDAAADARLIAVQLPRNAVGRTHGLWLNAYVLDGLRYILARAPTDAPVVVNLSLAGQIGPHDGNSLLERAIDDLVQWQQGRLTVLLAAGNARDQRLHAHDAVSPNQRWSVSVENANDDGTPGFVEFWLRSAAQARPEVRLQLVFDGADCADVASGSAWVQSQPGRSTSLRGRVSAMVALDVARGGPGAWRQHALLAIGHTKNDSLSKHNAPAAPVGTWTVTVHNRGLAAIEAHAWIARDEVPEGYRDGPAARSLVFVPPTVATQQATMNCIAWGRSPVVVGAYLAAVSAPSNRRMYAASGQGSTARRQPDLCGSSGLVRDLDDPILLGGAAGLRFVDSQGHGERAMIGTSMAVPYVARRVVNLLSDQPANTWRQRTELLASLKAAHPSLLPTTAVDPIDWTSGYWI